MRCFLLLVILMTTGSAFAACGGQDDPAGNIRPAKDPAPDPQREHSGGRTPNSQKGTDGDDEGAPNQSGRRPPPRTAAGKTVVRFFALLSKGRGNAACSLLIGPIRQQLVRRLSDFPEFKGKNCAAIIPLIAKSYTKGVRQGLANTKIVSVRGRGSRLIVTYDAGPENPRSFIPVVADGKGWKIAAHAGTPVSP